MMFQDQTLSDWPPHLSERVRALNAHPGEQKGTYVLYWMHHAVRAHENPTLDVAVWVGNRWGLPVLVYQGLGGRHPYNSDRHHTFIMEGARDVQRSLAERGITYAFHLGSDPEVPSPLRTLCNDAALVITEDYPAPPFPNWYEKLRAGLRPGFWVVDSACIVPMQSVDTSYARAFQFREEATLAREQRIHAAWQDIEPEVPPLTRDTEDHARKIDLDRYTAHVQRPTNTGQHTVAIIGAGFSGLHAGRTLTNHGYEVHLFDKSRGPGGRMATRRADAFAFDHGLNIMYQTRIEQVERAGEQWRLIDEKGTQLGDFDVLLITTPPSQALPLLTGAPHLAKKVEQVSMSPSWAVMAAFEDRLSLDYDGLFLEDNALSWAARNSSKPGRIPGENWVLHGSHRWSKENLEANKDEIATRLLNSFFKLTGLDTVTPIFLQAHRWRFALAESPLDAGCLWDTGLRLGVCGDWCMNSRVEGAFLSSMAVAGRVLGLPDQAVSQTIGIQASLF